MNIAQQLKQVEQKIEKLKFDLAVENAVYERLQALDSGNESSLFGNKQPIPGSMPSHIESVLTESGKAMSIAAIAEGVKKRGATCKSDAALLNNVRGTLKRRGDLFLRHKRGIYKLAYKGEKAPDT